MRTITQIRKAVTEVPAVADRARKSLDALDGGVRQANATMALLATVAILALVLATVALIRAEAVSRATR